jgi:hypothetical protein
MGRAPRCFLQIRLQIATRSVKSAYRATACSASVAGNARDEASSAPSEENARSGVSPCVADDAVAGYFGKKELFAENAAAAGVSW